MCNPLLSVIGLVSIVLFGFYCLYKFIYFLTRLGMALQGEEE